MRDYTYLGGARFTINIFFAVCDLMWIGLILVGLRVRSLNSLEVYESLTTMNPIPLPSQLLLAHYAA